MPYLLTALDCSVPYNHNLDDHVPIGDDDDDDDDDEDDEEEAD